MASNAPPNRVECCELIDLHFGTPRQPAFAAVSALVNPEGQVRESRPGLFLSEVV